MPGILVRFAINVLGLWLADLLIDGLSITGTGTFLAAGLLLGFVNAIVRPILVVLTLPLTVATLGLFLLVINAGMLALVAKLLPDFQVAGFGSALLGSLVVSITSWFATRSVGSRGRVEMMVIEERRER